jgi:hypothetical protein
MAFSTPANREMASISDWLGKIRLTARAPFVL